MPETSFFRDLRKLVDAPSDRTVKTKHVAYFIAAQRRYRWVGLYEVTPTEIGMIASTGVTPPAFPRFPITQGLCGAAVVTRAIVNSGNVREDPRWLATFGSTRSEIIVPVLDSLLERPIGLIDVESDLLNAFSRDDEQFLNSCAPMLLPLFL